MSDPTPQPSQPVWFPQPPGLPTKPYITSAIICEHLITEADGVHTAFRIIDQAKLQITLPIPSHLTEDEVEAFVRQLPGLQMFGYKMLVIIKAANPEDREDHTLGIVMAHEDGTRYPLGVTRLVWPVSTEQAPFPLPGMQITVPLPLSSSTPSGITRFELYIDNELALQVPLAFDAQLSLAPIPGSPAGPAAGDGPSAELAD